MFATASAGIRQEVAEPPSARAIRESQTEEPDFVAAALGEGAERLIERGAIFLMWGSHELLDLVKYEYVTNGCSPG